MKQKNFPLIIIALSLLAMMVSFCTKENDLNESSISSTDLQDMEDDVAVEEISQDIMNQATEIVGNLENNNFQTGGLKAGSCPVITVSDTAFNSFPKDIIIDYGEGCMKIIRTPDSTIIDTITRKGKVKVNITGRYREKGSVRTITTENYFVNGIGVEGVRTVENMGFTPDSIMWFKVTLSNGKIIFPDSSVLTSSFQKERYFVAGFKTLKIIGDDEYKIWGTVTGTNFKGETFTRQITDTLHIAISCPFIQSGKVQLARGDKDPIIIDYGSGSCDAKATISKNGETKEIMLRMRRTSR